MAEPEWRIIILNEFMSQVERHRRELLVHCYRMLGCLADAEDAVQETLLRAWRYRDSLKEGAPVRPWLYRVATNACLDAIARDARRVAVGSSDTAGVEDVVWLGPIPDSVLLAEQAVSPDGTPETRALRRENIEIAFLTAIQLLTPQQRAVLLVCDVLEWSAKDAADLLDISVTAVNSTLQRARGRLRERLPSSAACGASNTAEPAELDLVQKYVAASEAQDYKAFELLLREDARFRMPPDPAVATGRDAVFQSWREGGFGTERFGQIRCIATRANLQPAIAAYVRVPGDTEFRALTLEVLRFDGGLVTEIVLFLPDYFPLFGLPMLLDDQQSLQKG